MVVIILHPPLSVLATKRKDLFLKMTKMKQAVLHQAETKCISAERYLWWDKLFPRFYDVSVLPSCTTDSARTTSGTSVSTEAIRVSKVCTAPAHLCKHALKGEEDLVSTTIQKGRTFVFNFELVNSEQNVQILDFLVHLLSLPVKCQQ